MQYTVSRNTFFDSKTGLYRVNISKDNELFCPVYGVSIIHARRNAEKLAATIRRCLSEKKELN